MQNKDAPCLGCENRKIGCHSNCKAYIEFAEMTKKKNQAINMENQRSMDHIYGLKRKYGKRYYH